MIIAPATTRTIIDQISFAVPLPPSVNEAYPSVARTNKETGKRYEKRVASASLQNFKSQVWGVIIERHLIDRWKGATATGYKIIIYVPRSNADASNYLKAYEDAITQSLGFDDQYIVSGHFEKEVDARVPRIEGTWYRFK